ncbi:MAG: DUF1016 N-terminal domain-containing protein [Candidatus Kapabacteria bacterium]|nr:DUF1016 N-terminal domain-containing protein [Candidatus Kapabacteria bacterium]
MEANLNIIEKDVFLNQSLVQEISGLIHEARNRAATAVNSIITILYWQIGKRISVEILNSSRAEYGKQIVATLSQQLVEEFGTSFSDKNLRRMIQFAEAFPDEEIVVSLIRQLSWTHFIALIPIQDVNKRNFYIEMCKLDRWSVRTLRDRIDSMLYERTALSRKPEELIEIEINKIRETGQLMPELVLKDPYIHDFLGIKDHYHEKDLEDELVLINDERLVK